MFIIKRITYISKLNTKNVTNISFFFSYCSSLKELPDISKFSIINIKQLYALFYE